MKYITIDKNDDNFSKIEIDDILSIIEPQSNLFLWRIEYIDAVGDINNVAGMSMTDFEMKCNKSDTGIVFDFKLIKDIVMSCDDVIDILIIGNRKTTPMPKRILDIDKIICDIVISLEDSSIWELYSINQEHMSFFQRLKTISIK